jgi:putative hydrolase of the HAD superfamily
MLLEEIRAYREWFWSDPERNRRGRLELLASRQHVLEVALRRLGIDAPALAEEMTRAYSLERESRARPFPGAIATVEWLRQRGVRLALLTNGGARLQRLKVLRWGLASLFDWVSIEGEFGAGKPDLRVYEHALERLRATPEQTWMAGDNLEWDVGAPQQLGIFGIWIDHEKQGLPNASPVRPDRIIHALAELRGEG